MYLTTLLTSPWVAHTSGQSRSPPGEADHSFQHHTRGAPNQATMLRPSRVSGLLARSGRHVRNTGFPNCSPKAEKKCLDTGFPDMPLQSRYWRRGGWDWRGGRRTWLQCGGEINFLVLDSQGYLGLLDGHDSPRWSQVGRPQGLSVLLLDRLGYRISPGRLHPLGQSDFQWPPFQIRQGRVASSFLLDNPAMCPVDHSK